MRSTLFSVVVASVALMIGLFVGSAGMMLLAPDPAPLPGIAPGSFTVQEDDPGWDCRTMGNRMCGEETR